MMRYRYEIDDHNVVRVWDDENPNENGAPFFFQDIHPDGRPWSSKAEAQEWVEAFVQDLVTPALSE